MYHSSLGYPNFKQTPTRSKQPAADPSHRLALIIWKGEILLQTFKQGKYTGHTWLELIATAICQSCAWLMKQEATKSNVQRTVLDYLQLQSWPAACVNPWQRVPQLSNHCCCHPSLWTHWLVDIPDNVVCLWPVLTRCMWQCCACVLTSRVCVRNNVGASGRRAEKTRTAHNDARNHLLRKNTKPDTKKKYLEMFEDYSANFRIFFKAGLLRSYGVDLSTNDPNQRFPCPTCFASFSFFEASASRVASSKGGPRKGNHHWPSPINQVR